MNTALPPIPRKLSIYSLFPQYALRRLKIRLNGVEQRLVLAYDQDEGWLERYEQNPDGSFILADDLESLAVVRVPGNVTVEYAEFE